MLCGLGGFGRRGVAGGMVPCGAGRSTLRQPNQDAWDEAKLLAKRAVPVGMGLSVLRVNILTDTLLASWPACSGATIFGFAYPLEEGRTLRSLASRLYQFPLGVWHRVARFPRLSQTKDQTQEFRHPSNHWHDVFVGLPICWPVRGGHPMVRAVFEGGLFSR